MGVEHQKAGRLARHRAQQPDQQRVLHAVGEVAGVEGVAVVHAVTGAQAGAGRMSASSSGQRGRGAWSSASVQAEPQPLDPGPGDHDRVVAAQPQRRRRQAEAAPSAAAASTRRARSRSPRRRRPPPAGPARHGARRTAPSRARRGRPARRRPPAGTRPRCRPRTLLGSAPAGWRRDQLRHRRLQAGEREVAAGAAQQRPGQRVAGGVAARRQPLQRRAAGPAEAEQLADLVERLAHRVVDGAARAGVWRPTPSTATHWQCPPETSSSR